MSGEDQFLKTLFKESETKPVLDITEQVMQRIDKSSEVFEYQPLISKQAWVIIGGLFFGTLIYLFMQTESVAIKTPELMNVLSSGLLKVRNNFTIDWGAMQLPEIPSTLLISIAAINIIGIYLMVSYRWKRGMFR
ncbi:hypothetical protein [Ekhidna sp.]